MPDLLTHALLAYSTLVALSWRWSWLTPQYVTIGMAGALAPDLTKLYILFPDHNVTAVLGVPFSWLPLHTVGGILVTISMATILFDPSKRKRVFAVLAIGAITHLGSDALNLTPTGRWPYPVFWPFSSVHPPRLGLYLSTQLTPTLVALTLTVLVVVIDRYGPVKGKKSGD